MHRLSQPLSFMKLWGLQFLLHIKKMIWVLIRDVAAIIAHLSSLPEPKIYNMLRVRNQTSVNYFIRALFQIEKVMGTDCSKCPQIWSFRLLWSSIPQIEMCN